MRTRHVFAACGLVAAVAACGTEPVTPRAAEPSATATAPRVVPAGDRLAASGTVLAAPGQSPLFCPPRARTFADDGEGPRPPACWAGIPLDGVDVTALERRQERDGTVWGDGWLSGVYAAGTFTVVDQGPPRRDDEPRRLAAMRGVPCPEPPGGWIKDEAMPGVLMEGRQGYAQPSMDAVDRYGAKHPGEVLHNRYALPARDTSVVVVVVFDTEQAEKALRPAYGDRLCVVRARYTHAQVKAARQAAQALVGHPLVHSGGGYTASPDGQPLITVSADRPAPEVEAFVAAHPDGLVRADYWLAPVTS